LTIPLSRPVLTAYGVITFLTAWNMFLWPLIVVRSEKLQVVPMVIAEMSTGVGVDRGIVMAAVTLSILPIFVLWIVGQRWFVEGIAMTGMKG
jgi:ABC-type glycerol-3-phosphate transport system permease component